MFRVAGTAGVSRAEGTSFAGSKGDVRENERERTRGKDLFYSKIKIPRRENTPSELCDELCDKRKLHILTFFEQSP